MSKKKLTIPGLSSVLGIFMNHKITEPNTDKKVVSQQTKKSFERHRIAGTSYRQEAILSMGSKNPDYALNKTQLIKKRLVDVTVYEYIFSPSSVSLVPEPDNEYDSNAIKVIIDGVHVGYIKKGSCSHVKKLLNSNRIKSISAKIYGGNSKCVFCYDDFGDKNSYALEKDKSDFGVEITINLNDDSQSIS